MRIQKTIALHEEEGSHIQEESLYSLCQLPQPANQLDSLVPNPKMSQGPSGSLVIVAQTWVQHVTRILGARYNHLPAHFHVLSSWRPAPTSSPALHAVSQTTRSFSIQAAPTA